MTEIILHLGAHRTASTHVQGVLGKNTVLLAEAGIFAPAQEAVKTALTKKLGSGGAASFDGFDALLKAHPQTAPETMIISDENLLGFLNTIFTHGTFYPDTNARLKRLAQVLPHAPRKIVVSIRPYDSFFASAYGRWLRPGRMVLPREALAKLVLGLARGWPDVLADIANAFPDSKLEISEYSPNPAFGPAQLVALIGPLSDKLVFNPGFRWNRSMSARQTMLYEQAIAAGEQEKAADIRTWKRFKQPDLLEGFWEEATQTALKQRYLADRAVILKRFPAFVTAKSFEGQDAR